MSAPLARAARLKPEIRLAQAVSQFEADLSTEQKAAFKSDKHQSLNSPPDGNDVMRLTAEIDRRVAGKVGLGRCFGPRLVNILEAVQQFAALGDIVVGGSQNIIACGVWALVRTTLLLLVNFSSYFDKLSVLLMTAGRSIPRYQAMALLYPRSKNLQSHLSEYFLIVVRLCHEMLRSTRKSVLGQVMSLGSESDLGSYRSDFDLWACAIKEEVDVLAAQEIKQQSSQVTALLKLSRSEWHRKNVKTRVRVFSACSTYDYQTTWKEIRKSGNTTLFTQAREYQDWKAESQAGTLVYTGKLGSGKSVLLANMVDDLNLYAQNGRSPVAYFFCRHDDPESLKARTILGSLARQLLCTIQCPPATFEGLVDPDHSALDFEGILSLLKHTLPSTFRAYFILDGLDECDEHQKKNLIPYLRKLQGLFSLLICLSFRPEADNALNRSPKEFARPSIVSIPEDNPDIAEFICSELERCVVSGKLCLGDPTLILQIRDALLERAKGMFLWVVLQIESLRFAKTDDAISQALADLPRDLPATFSRILQQSEAFGKHYQSRTLQLVTAACRPLTTDELREALGVVPGDANWSPGRMPNDIYSALACCGSLVIVDEETLAVKLIHHSVKQFLLSGQESLPGQTFTIENANRTMGDVVITYLSYSIFETQLSTTVVPQVRIGAIPSTIIRSTLDSSSSVRKIALRLLKTTKESTSINKVLAEEGRLFNTPSPTQFHFLLYAKSYWLQHIKHVALQEPATYRLLGRILERHVIDINMRDENGQTLLLWAAENGYEAVIQLLLEKGATVDVKGSDSTQTPLLLAAKDGHVAVVRLLLEKGAAIDVNDLYGQTPLSWATENGHVAVIQLLLEKGATIDVKGSDLSQTLLLWAIKNGHDAIIRLLLEKGAAVDVKGSDLSQTSLFWAVENGHEVVARLLLEKGAAVDFKDSWGRTSLFWAVENGHEVVARLLLETGAAVDVKDSWGQILLFLAVENGHEAVIRLLLEKGAAVDVKDSLGRTSLFWAVKNGHEAITRLLLEKGAAVDVKDSLGQTSLFWAVKNGHDAIIRLLLEKGAAVDVKDSQGQTPLLLATKNGHEVVARLLKS